MYAPRTPGQQPPSDTIVKPPGLIPVGSGLVRSNELAEWSEKARTYADAAAGSATSRC